MPWLPLPGEGGSPGDGSFFMAKKVASLTDRATTQLVDYEAWGTTITFDQAAVPAVVTVEARITGGAEKKSADSSVRTANVRIAISLDGGATWDYGAVTNVAWVTGGASGDRRPITAQHLRTGAVSGQIRVRAEGKTFSAAGDPTFTQGNLLVTVTQDVS